MSSSPDGRNDLLRLAAHLRARREALLKDWRDAVAADRAITTAATLARSQFVDHMPQILDAFERQLRARGDAEAAAASEDQRRGASEHGVHRWLHGYHYRETMREWGHLQTALAREVEDFTLSNPDLDPTAMSVARTQLMRLFVDCMVESAAGHVTLLETEAASRLRDLEQVLGSIRALERERAELWHEAAHDLRGNVSAVQLAATVLARGAKPAARPEAVQIVARTATTLKVLLDDLIELARLEAGRERRRLAEFDAAQLLREVCGAFQPVATERRLFLKLDAPPTLAVEGDAVKVRRIAQNLVLNALRYTERGGVQVEVAPTEMGRIPNWCLTIRDTGVGITDRAGPAIARLLHAASLEADALAPLASTSDTLPSAPRTNESPDASDAPGRDDAEPASAALPHGEGVGLTIVKRLCELLDATIEIETASGRGTTFRIVFPRRYSAADGDAAAAREVGADPDDAAAPSGVRRPEIPGPSLGRPNG